MSRQRHKINQQPNKTINFQPHQINLLEFRIDHHTFTTINRRLFALHRSRTHNSNAWMRHTAKEKERKRKTQKNTREKKRFVICKRTRARTHTLHGIPISIRKTGRKSICSCCRRTKRDTTNLLCCVENPYNASLWPYFIRTFYFILF